MDPIRVLARRDRIAWFASDGRLVVRGPRATLERIREAHEAVVADEVPRPAALDGEELAFDCAPLGTMEDLRTLLPPRSVPYAEAIVVTRSVARAMAAAHPTGFFFGALSPSQIIVDRSGRLQLLGLGFGEQDWDPAGYRSPSVAIGSPPNGASDVHTGLLLVRGHVHYVAGIPAPLARLLRGEPGPFERAFSRMLVDALTQSQSLDGARALAAVQRFWDIMGITPDQDGFARRARDAFDEPLVRVDVARDHAWIAVEGGPRHDLLRREPARRVLRALLDAQGAPMSVDDLARTAWPGETLVGSSGPDRVYVAISSLRKLDLRDAIARVKGGYALRVRATFRDPNESNSARAR